MDCQEARRLIKQGITPKPHPPEHAQLGFHLANCSACRAFYEYDHALLSNLLLEQDPSSSVDATQAHLPKAKAPLENTPKQDTEQEQHRVNTRVSPLQSFSAVSSVYLPHILRIIAIALLVLLPLGGVLWFASVMVRSHQNISSMIVTPVAGSTPPPTAASKIVPIADAQEGHLITDTNVVTRTEDGSNVSNSVLPTEPITSETALGMLAPIETTASPVATPTPDPIQAWQGTDLAYATPIGTRLPDVDSVATPWPSIESLLTYPTVTPVPLASWGVSANPPLKTPLPAGDGATILLLGNDRRPGETDIPRTDAIMLLRADTKNQRLAMLSLPRDLWVDIPGYGSNRINAAYVWGEMYQAPGGGLGLASQTVSNLLGIRIDYVVMVDLEGFINLIQVLGGITVDVEKELYDANFPTMDYGYQVAHFLPGRQQMDGKTALMYSRIRHPDSDFMRTGRQQAVIVGIAERLRERGDLQNLSQLDAITGALKGYVLTDMPEDRIVSLVWALRNMQQSQVEHYRVTSDMVQWGVGSDTYALVAAPEILHDLTNKLLGVE